MMFIKSIILLIYHFHELLNLIDMFHIVLEVAVLCIEVSCAHMTCILACLFIVLY